MEQSRRRVHPFVPHLRHLVVTFTVAAALAGCLEADDGDPDFTDIPLSAMSGPEGTSPLALVAARSTWEYDDRGVNLGTGWRVTSPSSTWTTGAGPLGYGEPYVVTVVSYGASATSKNPTTYFRRAFDSVDPARIKKLYLRAMFDDGFVFYINGHEGGRAYMPGGTISYRTLSTGHETGNAYMTFDVSSQIGRLDEGANTLAVEVHQQSQSSSDLTMDFELIAWVEPDDGPAVEPTARGIPAGATWTYWDQGGDLGTAWRSPDYVATGWSAGAAPLGFGESYIATRTDAGPITTYFRHDFLSNGSATGLQLHGRYDDGFVAYLNGTEIFREAMPQGPITASTLALNHEAAGMIGPFNLSQVASLIREGKNTLAIEVHQASATSSDLVWDGMLVEETAWQPQISGTTEDLNDIVFQGEGLGWIVGNGGTLLRTGDNGKTWAPRSTGTTADLHAIVVDSDDYGEPERGWIVGDDGVILRTGDGGETWIDDSLGVPAQLRDLAIVGSHGWAVARLDGDATTADLYATDDGGLTWQPRPTGISGGDFAAVLFTSNTTGWITGTTFDEDGGTIWKTTDGGFTWTQQWTFGQHGGWPSSLTRQFPSTIWMTGQYSFSGQGELKVVSHDGGATWEEAPHTADDLGIYGARFSNTDVGVGVGLYGSIVITHDGGETWTTSRRAHFYEHATLNAVEFTFPPDRGWAVGTGGTILMTTSGGDERGWVMREPDDILPFDVWFTDDQRGWLLGAYPQETRDGGETWTPFEQGSANAIEFLADDLHGWIVGREKTSVTTDGGETWVDHALDPSFLTNYPVDFSFVSPTTGWMVVHNYSHDAPADLYKTTDGGATWIPTPTGVTNANWLDVDFVDENVGFVLGDHYSALDGSVWKTVDGGDTWFQPSDFDRILTALHAIDANTIWTVGGAIATGDLARVSHDGGGTWQDAPSTGQEPLDNVYFLDALYGWCVGKDGTLIGTRDGGVSWDVQIPARVFARPLLHAVHFSDRYNGWAVGSDRAVLETSTGGY